MIQIQFFWYAAERAHSAPCLDEIVRAFEQALRIWCEIIAIQWDNLSWRIIHSEQSSSTMSFETGNDFSSQKDVLMYNMLVCICIFLLHCDMWTAITPYYL